MNEFSARISLRRLAQVYTDVKKARDYGFEGLQSMIREAVAQNISTDRHMDAMYNSRLEVFSQFIGNSAGFAEASDLVEAVIIDQFCDELKNENTSALDAFSHFTFGICKFSPDISSRKILFSCRI
jgi:hypothetical protein